MSKPNRVLFIGAITAFVAVFGLLLASDVDTPPNVGSRTPPSTVTVPPPKSEVPDATTTVVATTAAPPPPSQIRGIYGDAVDDGNRRLMRDLGFNVVYVPGGDVEILDALRKDGLWAIVWLGAYRENCTWEWDDEMVRSLVVPIADHPAVLAYQLGDEPGNELAKGCERVVEQYRDRDRFVKSLDPATPTYTVLAAGHGGDSYPYAPWADVLDIYGLDIYPCSHDLGCRFELVDEAATAAAAAGIDEYLAVTQEFGDDWYRMPTPAQVRTQIEAWEQTAADGYVAFDFDRSDLVENPRKQDVYRSINSTEWGRLGED